MMRENKELNVSEIRRRYNISNVTVRNDHLFGKKRRNHASLTSCIREDRLQTSFDINNIKPE